MITISAFKCVRTPTQATRILRGASQVLISNRRGDMPFGEPFG